MRIINTLLKIAVFCLSLSAMSLHAEPAIYDDSHFQLKLPSVAIVANGKIEGYVSVSLQVLSNFEKKFTVLDNAYATAILDPIQTLSATESPSATYDKDSQQLNIPAFALKNAKSDAPTTALNLRILATLDNMFVLGL